MNNPFTPSFGTVPNVFLDRDSLSRRVITELNSDNLPFTQLREKLIFSEVNLREFNLILQWATIIKKQIFKVSS